MSLDDSAAREIPSVVQIVRSGNFVGVVAEREEQAIRSAEALKVTWAPGVPLPANDRIYDLLREMPLAEDGGGEILCNGDVDGGWRQQPRHWRRPSPSPPKPTP